MSILSGLTNLGLGNLEDMSLYGDIHEEAAATDQVEAPVQAAAKEINEAELLFDKSYECPVCDTPFKNKTVRAGKAHLTKSDLDLRPKYEPIDILKYDVIFCPHCGYAALTRYFNTIARPQAKLIAAQITPSFKQQPQDADMISYDEAIMRHQMALACTIVKRARVSERAFTCMKLAWVVRGKAESLDPQAPDYMEEREKCIQMEEEALQNALDGFVEAIQTEAPPICGMDGDTIDYLLSALYVHFEQYDKAAKVVSSLLLSRTANKRTKDKARNLKDIILEAKRNEEA